MTEQQNQTLKERLTVFLDTNIYLHCTFFADIPWEEILNTKLIKMAVPPITLNEIDKQKYSSTSSSRIKQRAVAVTKRMSLLLDTASRLRPSVGVDFIGAEPTEFESHQLIRDSQDDQLLASILQYKANYPEDDVVLVTNDMALKVKARQRGIVTTKLSDEYLKLEEDQDQKKIRKLEEEVRALQSRIPKLRLQFAGNSDRLEVPRVIEARTESEYLRQEMNAIRNMHPERHPLRPERFDPSKGLTSLEILRSLAGTLPEDPDPLDLKRYNEELGPFYEKYEKYLKRRFKYEQLITRSIKLEIEIENVGTVPAEDIGVFMKVNRNLAVAVDESLFSEPEPPEPPREPRSQFSIRAFDWRETRYPRLDIVRPNLSSLPYLPNTRWGRLVEEGDWHIASFEVRKLNHGYSTNCPRSLYVVFDSTADMRSFNLEYTITAGNMPVRIEGKLHVILSSDPK